LPVVTLSYYFSSGVTIVSLGPSYCFSLPSFCFAKGIVLFLLGPEIGLSWSQQQAEFSVGTPVRAGLGGQGAFRLDAWLPCIIQVRLRFKLEAGFGASKRLYLLQNSLFSKKAYC
jgi:hypothetical protein